MKENSTLLRCTNRHGLLLKKTSRFVPYSQTNHLIAIVILSVKELAMEVSYEYRTIRELRVVPCCRLCPYK